MIHESKFFDNFGQFLHVYPEVDLIDVFSKGQIESKRWLVNELVRIDLPLGIVFLCAGWYGNLATFLFESGIPIEKIRSFDIDPSCAKKADTFNRHWVIDNWKFKASTLDITKMQYPTSHTTYRADGTSLELEEMPDTVINTSCEHIIDFKEWYSKIPTGTLVVLQNNNYYQIDEHINCVESINEFKKDTPMQNLLFEGELNLQKYTRFMRIGYK